MHLLLLLLLLILLLDMLELGRVHRHRRISFHVILTL